MEENNYQKHFNRELKILRENNKGRDLVIDKFVSVINEIINISSKQGHSGCSAHWYANTLSNTIKSVLLFNPLSPITGKDSEWVDVCDDVFQNKRLGSVFKDKKTNKSHYLDAIVFKGKEDGDSFTGTVENVSSRQFIKFPFTPKTFYIDVVKFYIDKDSPCDYYTEGDRRYIYKIKDRNQLNQVKEYYGINKLS